MSGVHGFGMHRGLLPGRGGRDQGFDVEFVRIEQQADERHLVVGLVADVADDDDAGMAGEVVDVGGRELGADAGGEQRGE